MSALIELLREYRIRAGLSMSYLSTHAGYDPTYVHKIERGKKFPSRGTILAWADVLELTRADTDRLLFAAGLAPETDYQTLYESRSSLIEGKERWCRTGHKAELDLFGKDSSRSDGMRNICKPCDAKRQGVYRLRQERAG